MSENGKKIRPFIAIIKRPLIGVRGGHGDKPGSFRRPKGPSYGSVSRLAAGMREVMLEDAHGHIPNHVGPSHSLRIMKGKKRKEKKRKEKKEKKKEERRQKYAQPGFRLVDRHTGAQSETLPPEVWHAIR